MKITKYVHACLLAEQDGSVVLFDPGQMSWSSKLLDIAKLTKLDTIVITHEHEDHFYLPFVEALVEKFPEVQIISTGAVVTQLAKAGIKNASTKSSNTDIVIFSNQPHADLSPLGQAPENIAVHYKGKLTVGGDRHDLEESKDILALTITAPWGSMMNAAAMALRLKPKFVVPVHDWHWNDQARQGAYSRFDEFLGEQGIAFIKAIDGQVIEI